MPTAAAPENAIAVNRYVRVSLGLIRSQSMLVVPIRDRLTNFDLDSHYSSLRTKAKTRSEREC